MPAVIKFSTEYHSTKTKDNDRNCWIYLESFTIFGRAALRYQIRVNSQMALTPSGLPNFQKIIFGHIYLKVHS